eukprot:5667941-Amphidinium_carterae.1
MSYVHDVFVCANGGVVFICFADERVFQIWASCRSCGCLGQNGLVHVSEHNRSPRIPINRSKDSRKKAKLHRRIYAITHDQHGQLPTQVSPAAKRQKCLKPLKLVLLPLFRLVVCMVEVSMA